LVLLVAELVVDREVGEVEETVAHAGVLPVDDPDASSVVDEVRIQEVVVARREPRWASRSFDRIGDVLRPDVVVGHGNAVVARCLRELLDDAEGIEPAGDRGAVVDAPERLGDAGDGLRPAHLLDRDRTSLDEAGDQVALRLDEGCDLRADAGRSGRDRSLVLVGAIDSEELRVRAADAQDERLPVDDDLEVVVRDPAAERLDLERPPRPDAGCDRLGLHQMIL
jgi:hypothetical protein